MYIDILTKKETVSGYMNSEALSQLNCARDKPEKSSWPVIMESKLCSRERLSCGAS